jgi:hypothetical protein
MAGAGQEIIDVWRALVLEDQGVVVGFENLHESDTRLVYQDGVLAAAEDPAVRRLLRGRCVGGNKVYLNADLENRPPRAPGGWKTRPMLLKKNNGGGGS